MIDFLTNSWIIGIGGGIISGLIVFLITNRIFSRRENREYMQKIKMANKELLYSIRPLIVGQKLPTQDLIDSIIFSTSRKYGVDLSDIYENNELAEDLTKEILDNPFLNSESKLKYCEIASKLKELETIEEVEDHKREVIYINKTKPITKEFFSLTLATMTTLTVVLATFIVPELNLTILNNGKDFKWPILIILIMSTPIVAIMLTKIIKSIRKEEEINITKKETLENIEIKSNKIK